MGKKESGVGYCNGCNFTHNVFGSSALKAKILETPGAIGYTSGFSVKHQKNIKAAKLENREGYFRLPTTSNAAAGLGKIQLEDSTARPVGVDANPAGRESYSIVSLTWVLAYREGNNGKLSALKELFTWMVSDEAQSMAPDHGYVSLPTLTLDRARQAIELLQE